IYTFSLHDALPISSHGRQVWISAAFGFLCRRTLPRRSNLKCLTTLVTYAWPRSIPASWSAWSHSAPPGPPNGRPALSSPSPGTSPTSIIAARAAPSPKTVWVASRHRSQPLQPAAARRSFSRSGSSGMSSWTGLSVLVRDAMVASAVSAARRPSPAPVPAQVPLAAAAKPRRSAGLPGAAGSHGRPGASLLVSRHGRVRPPHPFHLLRRNPRTGGGGGARRRAGPRRHRPHRPRHRRRRRARQGGRPRPPARGPDRLRAFG